MQKIIRYVSFYEKGEDGRKLGELSLPDDSLETLKCIFDPPLDDPFMYDNYYVTEKAAKCIKKEFGMHLELDKYDYSVQCGYTD
ncbi:DUF7683 domain-containing protein [Microvirga thermotolerans]|uniref:DUF7683 domain-containing protein n=1 Tax=Microvirga thermotolerans TaxID=2651334 RepID=A0A5P9JVV2_9HYPH|nr:hypothetical protein [Microvirga thermotolerans]QFU16339.1 hypothetical protein GDR74_08935 [Microvirga thermotolerans]